MKGKKSKVSYHLKESIKREVTAVPCPKCNGYADRVSLTKKEIADNSINCGRPYECCGRAFVCRVCGLRIVGQAEAPEME